MEKLKSILKLKFIKEMPRENKMAYLLSVGMGVIISIIIVLCFIFSEDFLLSNHIKTCGISIAIPITAIILLLILSNKFPIIQNNIKIRFVCIILLLISYIYIFNIVGAFQTKSISDIIVMPLMIPVIFLFGIIWTFEYPSQSPLLITFLYSNIFIIIAAYLATKGITNLFKRIILFLIIAFLICATAATPLIMMHGSG